MLLFFVAIGPLQYACDLGVLVLLLSLVLIVLAGVGVGGAGAGAVDGVPQATVRCVSVADNIGWYNTPYLGSGMDRGIAPRLCWLKSRAVFGAKPIHDSLMAVA